MIAATVDRGSLPPDIERRLAQFIELVGTAIANTEARVELARLADEQAALRRVATLVAEEVPALELFAKVGEEVAGVLGPEIESAIFRYEGDETATVLAGSSDLVPGGIRVGLRLPLDGGSVTAQVFREKRVVRVDDYAKAGGSIADHAGKHEITTAIGCPIVVKGRLWGSMVVAHREREPFPADTERRVMQFTELVATAIANAEARAQLQRLADEQAALRRVATLVAEASAPDRGLRCRDRGGGAAARRLAGRDGPCRERGRVRRRRLPRAGTADPARRDAPAARGRQRHRHASCAPAAPPASTSTRKATA